MKSSAYKSERVSRLPVPSRAAKSKDSELVGVYAWRKGQALVRSLLGPPPARPGLSPSREPAPDLGADRKAPPATGSPGPAWTPASASAHRDPLSPGPPATIHTAMAILQDLRQQIQAGLEMAQRPRGLRKPKPQNPAGRRHQGPPSAQAARGSSPRSPWAAGTEGTRSSLGRARNFHAQKPWGSVVERKPSLQRACTAEARDRPFPRPEGPSERSGLFPSRPWTAEARGRPFPRPEGPSEWSGPFPPRPRSALAGQAYLQKNRAAPGQDFSQRPGSPPERLSSTSLRPPSTVSAWAAIEDQQVPVPRPWSPPETPRLSPQPSWSSSLLQKAGPPPPGAKEAWQQPPWERDTPRPKPQKDSSESLRDFMRRKAQARRHQALEQKALAARTLEQRNQRLREVYRKQREAVVGKGAPVVSQTNPSIVTFVPSSAQAGGLEAPGTPGLPVLEWSKVTSGKVLGDQEASSSFCLCLNRAWNGAETLDSRGRPDGLHSVSGAPPLPPAPSPRGAPKRQAPPRGPSVHAEPREAEALGRRGPLHLQYKQARLQALETMADVLQRRIDLLTAKLRRAASPEAAGSLALDPPPRGPAPSPPPPPLAPSTLPEDPGPCGGGGEPRGAAGAKARSLLPASCLLDAEMLPWPSRWRPRSLSTPASLRSQAKDSLDEDDWELKRPLHALSTHTWSSLRAPATGTRASSSLWLEEVPSVRAASLVTPWTGRSCGEQEPRAEDLRSGRFLANLQQKSRSFLQSMKLDRWKQEKALSLLRQRAEQEVWETQMALDELLFKHQLEGLMKSHPARASPGKAVRLEPQQPCWGSGPTRSGSAVMARPRSLPLVGRDATARSQSPGAVPRSRAGPAAAAMLEQSLHAEELHARHQAALVRLRELALEEKARAEMAWLERPRR
ncbi:LOW QUALITY PROTEIN: coiled-coil domain-containing protein 187 [Perognathus longimembris pacificus]|uniref:LOW QUALITY PROTEIN: coiled-coil domain-containing protein 187 n=1 Tax=Perognathus longimembris pacificus TaxID=214514 RepID=UPI00201855B3|nr:LOW QUALITY PROTEIN: coiled-coil domain-containing protein 187 [Perognathus longimembris pacificus]